MTKRQFMDLAANLYRLKPSGENKYATQTAKSIAKGRMDQWLEMARGMADFCSEQNRRFDRKRFLVACGYHEGSTTAEGQP